MITRFPILVERTLTHYALLMYLATSLNLCATYTYTNIRRHDTIIATYLVTLALLCFALMLKKANRRISNYDFAIGLLLLLDGAIFAFEMISSS